MVSALNVLYLALVVIVLLLVLDAWMDTICSDQLAFSVLLKVANVHP